MRAPRLLPASLLLAAAAGCAAPEVYDYGPWLDHMPRSVLVLPPLNESPEVTAPYAYLSTVTAPVVRWGYYVFPVAMVDAFLKENGHPTPWEMHQVPPERLHEVFGADAVLYLTVREWGKEYQVFNCHFGVTVDAVLVDCRTGTVLWKGASSGCADTFGTQNDPTLGILPALIGQLFFTTDGTSREIAGKANQMMVPPPHVGPRHPGYEEAVRRTREAMEKRKAGRPEAEEKAEGAE
ncbi:MAG: DUF799 family lipoprotein [Planctomycetaceae bacterium]|nr:DUF799 domain-containing protein [Planctomycetota bacterium]NUN53658.1 DUF799 family lipoprotein [Planctomycetaceae bacterium]